MVTRKIKYEPIILSKTVFKIKLCDEKNRFTGVSLFTKNPDPDLRIQILQHWT